MEILVFLAAFIYSAASVTMTATNSQTSAAVDGLDLTACTGANVTFNWTVDVPPGGQVISAVWLFESQVQNNVTIASLVNGHFYRIDNRLTYRPNAGIHLSDVRIEESGRYYVIVQLANDFRPGFTTVEKRALLTVFDTAPVIQDGQLHVTLGVDVIREESDEASSKWTVYLRCGQFLSRGQPPLEVVWITPKGDTVKGTYEQSSASFSLPLAATSYGESGIYTCRLVMTQNVTRCLADTNPSMRTEAQLQVNEWDVRLKVMEAQLKLVEARLSDKYRKDRTREMIHKRPHYPCSMDHVNAQWADYQRLDMRIDDVVSEGQRLDSRIDNAISLQAQLDKRLDDAESQDHIRKDQLENIVEKNDQQDRVLEQQDSQMAAALTKIKQLDVQQEQFFLRNETQDTQLKEAVVKLDQKVQEQGKQLQKLEGAMQQQLEQFQHNMTLVRDGHTNATKFEEETTSLENLTSCAEWKKVNCFSGVRNILVNKDIFTVFRVYCDQDTDRGGWTVFQRRVDASVNFYRGWKEYQDGFGNLTGNFWLGLDRLHIITSSRPHELRVDLQMWNGTRGYATYSNFYIDGPAQKYRLHFDNFTGGNAGDSLSKHQVQLFSTYDADNDGGEGSCALSYKGGWWYNYCHDANLNGDYKPTSSAPDFDGLNWDSFGGDRYSLKFTEMKIRPL